MHQRLILIETSTALCSTALTEDGVIVASRVSDTPRAHASMTAVFISEMLQEGGLRASDCDAVCLSMGPGSYTGLRVGSSTAKGICFGAGLQLLAVGTLDVLAAQAIAEGLPEGCRGIVPMIDARRMEVYTALYAPDGTRLTEVAPVVVEGPESLSFLSDFGDSGTSDPCNHVRKGQNRSETGSPATATTAGVQETGNLHPGTPSSVERSAQKGDFAPRQFVLQEAGCTEGRFAPGYSDALNIEPGGDLGCLRGSPLRPLGVQGGEPNSKQQGGLLFVGDGAGKCEALLGGPGCRFRQECPRAESMLLPAMRELLAGNFRDTAYFEPFYLKDFVATTPKKLF